MLQTDTARSENAVMHSLLAEAFEAHGGLERWRGFSALSATIVTGGEFWAMKGLVQDSDPRCVTVELRREWGSLAPFGNPDWHTDFTPDRIAILDMLLMKMGLAEFLYFETIPPKVTINEYIDLAKDYSTVQSGQFVNGILDNIHKELLQQGKMQKVDYKKA